MPINRNDPAARQRLRDYQRRWAQQAHIKAKRKQRDQDPKRIARRRELERLRTRQPRQMPLRATTASDRAYAHEYRRRDTTKAAERERAAARRSTEAGAALNRQRVKAWRASAEGRAKLRLYQRITSMVGTRRASWHQVPELLEMARHIDTINARRFRRKS